MWLRVPVGRDAEQWVTRTGARRVLFVVHNVTSATRLLDVLPLFDSDLDVQALATCTGSSPFLGGVADLLARAGLPVLPWEQARETDFDLVVSASYGGELDAFQGKLAILSHGVGYNKRLATPDTGHRTPDTGHRTPDTGRAEGGRAEGEPAECAGRGEARTTAPPSVPVFGLAPEWLLHGGVPLAAATVLSHPEQLERLRLSCPEAVPTAVLAGDPCFDRILAALPSRESFRRRLGVTPGQRLVVLNSTWGPHSLFAQESFPWLLRELTGSLPVDEYRICAVLHPNIWHGHGPGQIDRWLRRARDAGLTVIPPLGPWRQALVASDAVIGDHGSVTFYAAAIGRPVLLGAFPHEDLDPASPVAALGRTAPHLRPYKPPRPQIEGLLDGWFPGRHDAVTAQTTSAPGESGTLLRRTFYRLLRRDEPPWPALLDRLPAPDSGPARVLSPLRVVTRMLGDREVSVTRYAEPAADPEPDASGDAHTVVPDKTPDPSRIALADLVLSHGPDDPADGAGDGTGTWAPGPAVAWATAVSHRFRYAAMAVAVTGRDSCLVRTADGTLLTLTGAPTGTGPGPDPAVYASALHAWLESGHVIGDLIAGDHPGHLTVVTGTARHQMRVTLTP
ncbi:hypothetical protein [Streptomyces sp. NBC_01306]|uniref:hypothetical protein n=1 Tax=Streptomyces sp. NBC_01306 TaxID=2903819 RepID=UPI002259023D|nr:hypothetical protein [Streptomyces sp. NBC_01306]MCX4727238.1 hypothetical protein [Streptomyces sp. NBC_01306]